MHYPHLLKPLTIETLVFPNRIVMPPMVTFLAGADGMVTQAHIDHYRRSSGPGLIIVEGTAVTANGKIGHKQLGIYNDRHIEGLNKIAETIKSSGSIAGLQLHHAGATAFTETINRKFNHYVAIMFRLFRQHFLFSGLNFIREAFKHGARRAVEAGFDIIEIHAAHGYLFNQFLSPMRNWRVDRYGGKLENRRRLLMDVFRAVAQEVSGRAFVTCRLGIADKHQRGFSLPEGLDTASLLVKEGAKLLDISNGNDIPAYVRPKDSQFSARLHLAQEAKSVLQVPIIGGGGIRHPKMAEQALQDDMIDMIYVGHGLLADPAWARKTIEGKSNAIVLCQNCKHCFHFTDASRCPARMRSNQFL